MRDADIHWADANQRELVLALAAIKATLAQFAGQNADDKASTTPSSIQSDPPAYSTTLNKLTQTFALSPFEQSILLLCAGIELDSAFAPLCAQVHKDAARNYPTFSLALGVFPDAHWSALSPSAPLRRWRLLEFQPQSNLSLTHTPLRIDERILHFLTGIDYLDERLQGLMDPVASEPLVLSHQELARRIAAAWLKADHPFGGNPLLLIQLCGADEPARLAIAEAACASLGLKLLALPSDAVPSSSVELEAMMRLWEREAALTSSALCVVTDSLDRGDSRALAQVSRLLERLGGPLLLSTRDRWRPLRRAMRTFDVAKPTPGEQVSLWQEQLQDAQPSLNGRVGELVSQFNLSASGIRASVKEALSADDAGSSLADRLWEAGRSQARPRLDDLAQRIVPAAAWDDLVLPQPEKQMLREISAHVAHRSTVYQQWGFAGAGARGLGISALFAGASGTGKTMAAEVLAASLRLDLYRIDLSCVVNKYIGETEKNLRRVFDAAEDGGAILFFDEADALFGKRSEVKDSHDRYANIEINYLLQRMEAYRGLSVLATNMKTALDPAFLRRIRFVINFPFPDSALRAAIWERVFPRMTPVENLDIGKLAVLNVAGGNIRNIALNAAFLAASAGEPVRMPHIWRAACTEYAKMERPLTEVGPGAWR